MDMSLAPGEAAPWRRYCSPPHLSYECVKCTIHSLLSVCSLCKFIYVVVDLISFQSVYKSTCISVDASCLACDRAVCQRVCLSAYRSICEILYTHTWNVLFFKKYSGYLYIYTGTCMRACSARCFESLPKVKASRLRQKVRMNFR